MSRAHDLAVKLPDTMALFLAGRLRESRVKIIAYATAPLDLAEARAARELRQAGLEGSMDELRARAYLDLLLGKDSRPAAPDDGGPATARLWRSGSRRGPGRVRGAGDDDGAAGNAGRAGGPARAAGRDRAG